MHSLLRMGSQAVPSCIFTENLVEVLFSSIWFPISPIRRYNLGRKNVYLVCEDLHVRWCLKHWMSAQARNVLRTLPHFNSLLLLPLPPQF